MATPTRVVGQPLNLEIRRPPEVGSPVGLQVRLSGPDGTRRLVMPGDAAIVRDPFDVSVWRYVGSVRQPGYWEYQWEDATGVLDYGIVRVVATGF